MNKPNQKIFALVAVAFWVGMAGLTVYQAGCAKLAPAGSYNGDAFLFQVEQTTVTGYALLHDFVTWEKANQTLLSATPGIHAAADNVRKHAKEWFATLNRLHDAYTANPTAENKAALQKALDVINQAVQEALGYFAKYGPGGKPS